MVRDRVQLQRVANQGSSEVEFRVDREHLLHQARQSPHENGSIRQARLSASTEATGEVTAFDVPVLF